MEDIQIDDHVLVGTGQYSRVFMFTHKLIDGSYTFLRFTMHDRSDLLVTSAHFIYINGTLKPAHSAKVGDTFEKVHGERMVIAKIDLVQQIGLFNPQTEHGDIIVNDIRVSTYTEAIQPNAAHALLSVFRFLRRFLAFTCHYGEADSQFRSLLHYY